MLHVVVNIFSIYIFVKINMNIKFSHTNPCEMVSVMIHSNIIPICIIIIILEFILTNIYKILSFSPFLCVRKFVWTITIQKVFEALCILLLLFYFFYCLVILLLFSDVSFFFKFFFSIQHLRQKVKTWEIHKPPLIC